jgi:hypothetical protein
MKSIISLALILSSFVASAQLTIYRTFEDYQHEKGEVYDDYVGYSHVIKVKLKLIKDGEEVTVSCKGVWGFKYKEGLFRVHEKLSQPARVMSVGNIVYYENGAAHLGMLRDNTNKGYYDVGYNCYFSTSMSDDLVPMPRDSGISDASKQIKKFKKLHPEYADLFECIGKSYMYTNVSPCVKSFEGVE